MYAIRSYYGHAHVLVLGFEFRPHASLVGQDVQQRLVAITADGRVDRADTFIELQHARDIVHRLVQLAGDLFGGGLVVQLVGQFAGGT